MATPVNFPGVNLDIDSDGVKIPTQIQDGVLVSVWMLSDQEIQTLAETGAVQLMLIPKPPGMPAIKITPYTGDPNNLQVAPFEPSLN